MSTNNKMNGSKSAEYMRTYREKHPEYDINDCLKKKEKYDNDPEFRQRRKEQALAYYYKKKALKEQSAIIQAN